jgi:carbonic anhydrase
MKPCYLAALGMLALAAACARPGEAVKNDTHEVAAHGGPHWSYEGATGASSWGSLSPDWSPCGEGKSQSPIDIDQTMRADLTDLKAQFKPAALHVIHHPHVADEINNGHTIQVNYTEGDVATIGDEQFQLVQYHFHCPSEHTVHGQSYPMEMHLVHQSAAGHLAVVGVFIEEGAHNSAFDPIWTNLPRKEGAESHVDSVTVDVNQLLPVDSASYRYVGSLTTPPCSEGVQWIVMATPISMSAEQIAAFRAIIHNNNRPVQPLNGRTVMTDHVAMSGM